MIYVSISGRQQRWKIFDSEDRRDISWPRTRHRALWDATKWIPIFFIVTHASAFGGIMSMGHFCFCFFFYICFYSVAFIFWHNELPHIEDHSLSLFACFIALMRIYDAALIPEIRHFFFNTVLSDSTPDTNTSFHRIGYHHAFEAIWNVLLLDYGASVRFSSNEHLNFFLVRIFGEYSNEMIFISSRYKFKCVFIAVQQNCFFNRASNDRQRQRLASFSLFA